MKWPQACSRTWNDPKPAVERYSTFVDKHYILASLFWCYWFIKSYSKMWGYQLIQQNTGFSNLTNTVIIVTNISLQSYKYCDHCDQHLITKLQILSSLWPTSHYKVTNTDTFILYKQGLGFSYRYIQIVLVDLKPIMNDFDLLLDLYVWFLQKNGMYRQLNLNLFFP
jgi:hypothetical protein